MDPLIIKAKIPFQDRINDKIKTVETNALLFFPPKEEYLKDALAVFTHGYTSHKGSLLNWPLRLAEEGIASLVFDQPGHYLGTFCEVQNFEAFKSNIPSMFPAALKVLEREIKKYHKNFSLSPKKKKLIIGGHSLGALMALLASSQEEIQNYSQRQIIAVGLGLAPKDVTHIFNTPFYRSTLKMRGQLVSPAIAPEVIFPWIKEEKENLSLSGENIYLLTGEDDVIVGREGTERLGEKLEERGNTVTIEKPKKLGHHLPENAAPHIRKFLKDQGLLS